MLASEKAMALSWSPKRPSATAFAATAVTATMVVAALDDGQPRFSKLDEEDAPRLGLMERAQLVDGLHLHGLLVLQADFAGFVGGEIRVGARDAEAAEEAFAPAGGALCR